MVRRIAFIAMASLTLLTLTGGSAPPGWRHPFVHIRAWWLNQKGQKAFRLDRFEEALKYFQEAQGLVRGEPILSANEGTASIPMRRWKEAEEHLKEALKGLPKSKVRERAWVHYNLGNLYFARKRWSEAAEAYKETLRLVPDDRDAKWNLELVLRKLRRRPPPPPPPPDRPPPPPPPDEKNILRRRLQREMKGLWHGERDW